ncbi:MAG TPA: hypothetical protein ENJ73_04120, partial [Desulfobacterales bacterium]|nr:hypothetical protein [Desulfobacterales bacterium]
MRHLITALARSWPWASFAALCATCVTLISPAAAGVMERASVATDGGQANGASRSPHMSADGLIVAFASEADNLVPEDTNGVSDIFVHDRANGTTTRVSVATTGGEANGASVENAISANGRFVLFHTQATNLHAGGAGLYIHDRGASPPTTEPVAVLPTGGLP